MKRKSHRIDFTLTTAMFLRRKTHKQYYSKLSSVIIIVLHCFSYNVHILYSQTQNSDLRSLRIIWYADVFDIRVLIHVKGMWIFIFYEHTQNISSGRDSLFGIATWYGLDGPRIETRCVRNFPHPSRMALGPTQSPMQWVPVLSRR